MDNRLPETNSATVPGYKLRSKSASSVYLYLFILLGLLVLIGWAFYQYDHEIPSPVSNEVRIEETEISGLSGYILFTASLEGTPTVYSLYPQIKDALFEEYPAFEITAFPEFTDKFNPAKAFFSGSTEHASGEIDKIGLHSWLFADNSVTYYSGAAGNTERDLNWSEEAQRLAFFRIKTSANIAADASPAIDDNEIVIFDPAQNTIAAVIDGGVYPRWSPTGESLLFLKDDGIYEYNLAAKTETKIKGTVEPGTVLTPAEMLDVSPDNSRLVLTSQSVGLIGMFDIISWNPVVLKMNNAYEERDMHFTNPQFSPDGSKYALLVFDRVGLEFFEPRLEVRDSDSAQVLLSRSVEAFDMNQFYISDWIAGPFVAEVGDDR